MQRFYLCAEKELLGLPIRRFWGKEKNMQILKLQEKLTDISNLLMPHAANVGREIAKLEWRLSQLTGVETTGTVKDIKKRQKSIKTKELDDIKRMVMKQRRARKKAQGKK